jgi:biotin carboxylase
MPRVLLLLPTTSWRAEALLGACRRLGVEATVGTDRPLVWADRTPERVISLDFARPGEAAEQVAEFSRHHPLAAVVGADDETTVLAATFSAFLGLPHNPIAALTAARDKLAQRRALAARGPHVPPFMAVRLDEDPERIATRIGFPCVVKPLRLAGSRGVMRADDVAGLARALRRLAALLASPDVGACGEAAETAIVEAFVPGREVALDGLIDPASGGLRVLAMFDKPDPLDGPFFEETIYVTPSRLPATTQAGIAECAAVSARALGLTRGPVHAELRVNDRGVWLIELAARPIGGLCSRALRFGGNRSLEELLIMDALGMDTRTVEREPQSAGVMMLPIPAAGLLERVEGESEAAMVPGIEQVMITAHPGERMVPFPEGSRYPGFVFARGDHPAGVEAALRAAHRQLRFVMRASATPGAGAADVPHAGGSHAGEPAVSR